MIKKLLIANRGEIACRVIRTARRLGIATVAVYSDADRDALHVQMADEAVHIGGSPARESYLSIEKILAACEATGADAVHPGYGFLSENAAFAAALEAKCITFVGPPASAIEAMGDKITSKMLANDAGVTTVPGYMGLIAHADEAVEVAREIGYPVMIKASAGGGGKGMRIAHDDAEAREGFDRARSEAASSFGDDRVFIEKFVTEPRHIEIQLIGDAYGKVVYLNERECSIQRRNQKVIEEAPSPFLDEATRRAMGEQAVALAKAVGYRSAGTVEFIVDKDRKFYFLEMNTRLQVEHPVTEMITGLDIVELMLRVAEGMPLPLDQEDVERQGWAIECRLYAEDPVRNFLPSTGRLTRYRPPVDPNAGTATLRCDTGVVEGGEISTFYDPMIAKLVTWGPTREAAVAGMGEALDSFELEGVGNNLAFLSTVMGQERFQSGRLTTKYIEEEFPDGFHGATPTDAQIALIAASAAALQAIAARRSGLEQPRSVVVIGERRIEVGIAAKGDGFDIEMDGMVGLLRCDWQPGDSLARVQLGDEPAQVLKVAPRTGGFRIRHRGADLKVLVLAPHVAQYLKHMPVKAPPDMSRFLLCPMPGQVVRVDVAEGDIVEDGQALAIVEAMKMENILRAEKRARVAKVHVAPGNVLAVDQVMIEFEAV
jgi:propionyl-CoA carboxylase alpha chain